MSKFKLEFSLRGETVVDMENINPKDYQLKKELIETLKKHGIEIGDLHLSIDYKEPLLEESLPEKELEITELDRKKLYGLYQVVAGLAEQEFANDMMSIDMTSYSVKLFENDGRLAFHEEHRNADEDFAIWVEPKKVEEDMFTFTLYTVGPYENLDKTTNPTPFGEVTGHIDQIEDVLARKFLDC